MLEGTKISLLLPKDLKVAITEAAAIETIRQKRRVSVCELLRDILSVEILKILEENE